MSNAVKVDNLVHKYKDFQIINDISFFVKRGEFFIIIGPNGSGKTTIIKLLAGIESPESGEINIMGRLINNYSEKELACSIAFVPQNIPIDFPFTVSEVVLMGRSPHMGILGIEEEYDIKIAGQAMEFTDVGHLSDRRLNQLSGGEQQRVFIACAICQEPEIILLDEPTASLDLSHQIRIMDILEQLKQKKNMTVIVVSHDLNLAAMYAERLLLLKEGKIIKMGIHQEVLTYNVLEDVYGCKLLLDKSSLGNFETIIPVPKKFMDKQLL